MSDESSNQKWENYRELVLDNFKKINKQLDNFETSFDDLKNNHFHHLQLEMESLKIQIKMYGKFAVGLIAVPGIFLAILQIMKFISK